MKSAHEMLKSAHVMLKSFVAVISDTLLEMFQLSSKPNAPVMDENGECVGVSNGSDTVKLFPEARTVLSRLASNHYNLPTNTLFAVASSSEEPTYSRSCLANLTIDGKPMASLFHAEAIGRTGELTSRKTTHFKSLAAQLKKSTGEDIPHSTMLFFDDCNWGDHVGDLESSLGVQGIRTPTGLSVNLFEKGLKRFN